MDSSSGNVAVVEEHLGAGAALRGEEVAAVDDGGGGGTRLRGVAIRAWKMSATAPMAGVAALRGELRLRLV
jgi:hypothetical protein